MKLEWLMINVLEETDKVKRTTLWWILSPGISINWPASPFLLTKILFSESMLLLHQHGWMNTDFGFALHSQTLLWNLPGWSASLLTSALRQYIQLQLVLFSSYSVGCPASSWCLIVWSYPWSPGQLLSLSMYIGKIQGYIKGFTILEGNWDKTRFKVKNKAISQPPNSPNPLNPKTKKPCQNLAVCAAAPLPPICGIITK